MRGGGDLHLVYNLQGESVNTREDEGERRRREKEREQGREEESERRTK